MACRNWKGNKNPMYGRYLAENHPSWKGGLSLKYTRRCFLPIIRSMEQVCCMCGSREKLVAHHIDGNYRNNEISNLSVLCRGCHCKVHPRNLGKRSKEEKQKLKEQALLRIKKEG